MSNLLSRLLDAVSFLDRQKGAAPLEGVRGPALGMLNGVLGTGKTPPIRQRYDLLESYSRLPWLRSIVSRISYAVSVTPWEALVEVRGEREEQLEERLSSMTMRELGKRKLVPVERSKLRRAGFEVRRKLRQQKQAKGEVVELEDHPIIDLLEGFNPAMTGMAGFKLTEIYIDLVGEAFWLKERNALGVPVALWPLAPPWIESTPTPNKPFFSVSWGAWRMAVPEQDIVWFCDLDPARPYWRGAGTGAALADELETDEYAAKHTKREFFNNAVPELLVTADGLSEDETRRLERDWKHKNRGFFKALQVYFLNRKVDVKPLGQSFKSLQLIELRKWERDIIIEVFGVPPEILGIVNESKRATVDAADFLFARWVVTPRLELIRSVMQERLVPDFDERLIIDYESPVQEDKERQLNAAKAAPWALTIDEWRALQGHDPLPDNRGRVHMAPPQVLPTVFPERDDDGNLIEEEVEVQPPAVPAPAPAPVPPSATPETPPPEESPDEERSARSRRLMFGQNRKALVEALDRILDENLRPSA